MTTVAPARQRSVKPAPAVALSLPDALRALEAELNTIFFERQDMIDVILTTMLAGLNGFMEGDPGTGKSDLLETIMKAIDGAKYARFLMDPYTAKEDVFGAHDIAKFTSGGGWERDYRDTAADAHMNLFDEIDKANGAIRGSVLTLLNEGKHKPNGKWLPAPQISAWGAGNDWVFDSPALADRFMVHVSVEDLKEEVSFQKMFAMACAGRPPITSTIPLSLLEHAVNVEVPAVVIPAGVQESVRQLRSDLAGKGVRLSPRRWALMSRLIKAAAYKAGEKVASEDHLAVLQHAAFAQPEDRQMVRGMVLSLTSPVTKAALDLSAQMDSISAEIDARKRLSLAERALFGAEKQHQLSEVQTQLTEQVEVANREGRNVTVLAQVQDQIKTLRRKIQVECMNVSADRVSRP